MAFEGSFQTKAFSNSTKTKNKKPPKKPNPKPKQTKIPTLLRTHDAAQCNIVQTPVKTLGKIGQNFSTFKCHRSAFLYNPLKPTDASQTVLYFQIHSTFMARINMGSQ